MTKSNRNEIRQIIKGLDQEILASENLVNDLKEQYSQTDDGILQNIRNTLMASRSA